MHPPPASLWLGMAAVILVITAPARAQLPEGRLESLAADAIRAEATFSPPGPATLESAAVGLRNALRPLDALLQRSKSGDDWRKYLRWPKLEAQAASGAAADANELRDIQDLFGAAETGLELPEFNRVRQAIVRYAEAVDAARGKDGATLYARRLESLAKALQTAAASGSAESLAPVAPILERLVESGQAAEVIQRVRGALTRPNVVLGIHEDLFSRSVNRPVNQSQPVDEMILGTRVRGTGHTTGTVRLDFVPSHDRAAFEIVLAARNISTTRGTQGPVTVHTNGVTELGASRRILLDEYSVMATPVTASASTDSTVTGIGINKRLGRRIIQRVASRKIAETKPRAQAVAEERARERVRRQFAEQTDPAVAQIRDQFESRVRQPLLARGLYPEMLHLSTTDAQLVVTARKALPVQLAAASLPPPVSSRALITAQVHESIVNNVLEEKFGGAIFRQADVERLAKEAGREMPASLESDADQPPWEVTFSRYRPISLAVADGRVKVTVRGDKFVSGDRDYPGMDIWATYAIGKAPHGYVLLREGDVQIYPPGFEPGGEEKLSIRETSIRRILQKRFDKVFKDQIEIPDLPLEGELASAGPLPLAELQARRDGWIAAAWRARDAFEPATIVHDPVAHGPVVSAGGRTLPGGIVLAPGEVLVGEPRIIEPVTFVR
jgi:hypothetical protein